MQFYKERILNAAQLKRLSEHKYSCTSASILDAWLQPWWCWLVSKTPLWLAPNLITILGLIVNIVTTLILVWYSPDARQEPPQWAFALCALGVFVYQSLDAIDGKQARRTGSQSPLGELFDHGCDSISTVFIALGACIAVKLGEYPTWMFFQCFCAMTLFYCAHWQAYVTGTLKMGRIDVTEAQYTIIGIHLISATLGPDAWATKIGSLEARYSLGGAAVLGATLTLGALGAAIAKGGVGKNGSTVAIHGLDIPVRLFTCTLTFSTALYFVVNFAASFRHRGCGKNGSTVALPSTGVGLNLLSNYAVVLVTGTIVLGYVKVIMKGGVGRNGSTVAGTSILSPVIPFSLVVVPAFIIFQKSESQVYENHPALYIIAFGMVTAKVTNRLVVAHMTKSEMEYYDWSLLGPAMLFLNQYFNHALPEYYVLWLCTIWVVVELIRYCGQICLEICDHLHISLFRITRQSPATASPHDKNGTNRGRRAKRVPA
ncbi:choline/ethanolaminephosphotransferase 1 like protein [Danaus plexippus plexippus]|uniref:diacylglycerol cholinephosphotransferase n=1 Tax=Danaus plexippus plexippus TaxID=278856 RepID=A0A212EVL9_DANPL|nr:choline/ethanolaminephosphotransferase 1 like protein [Danaus plexippus plexippus]